jgi:hypothetical protein
MRRFKLLLSKFTMNSLIFTLNEYSKNSRGSTRFTCCPIAIFMRHIYNYLLFSSRGSTRLTCFDGFESPSVGFFKIPVGCPACPGRPCTPCKESDLTSFGLQYKTSRNIKLIMDHQNKNYHRSKSKVYRIGFVEKRL